MDIIPIPLDAIAGAAALLAVLIAGITEVAKKFGATDRGVVLVAVITGQLLSIGWWLANGPLTPATLYLAVATGCAATLIAMGLWKTIQPRAPTT